MSKKAFCDNCNILISENSEFINKYDKILYGYPRFYEIDINGNKRSFSYDSDDDEPNICYKCKIRRWLNINLDNNNDNELLKLFEDTFKVNLNKEERLKELVLNILKMLDNQ